MKNDSASPSKARMYGRPFAAVSCSLLVLLLGAPAAGADQTAPLVIGDTFTIDSKILGETRRINVYMPPGYAESKDILVPVLYMPD